MGLVVDDERMRVLGIDPGSVSAAYALLDSETGACLETDDVPVADKQVNAAEWAAVVRHCKPHEAIIEVVGAHPHQGVSSTFRFGVGTGLLRGVVLALGIPLFEAAPSKWKRHFNLDADAEKARALAIRYWPTCRGLSRRRDHGRAEAMLMARYRLETRS